MKEIKPLSEKQYKILRDTIGENVLISIGINEYKTSADNLTICVKDAKDIYSTFTKNEGLALCKDGSDLLITAENTTKQAIIHALETAVTSSQKGKNLIVYYSGHGVSIDGEMHFIPSDADPKNKEMLLSVGNIIDIINRSRYKNVILIIDACQTIYPNGKGIAEKNFSFQKKYISHSKGLAIIYSCSEGEYSQENIPGYENSIFTYQLIEALNGKEDALNGHYLTVNSLYQYCTLKSQEQSSAFQQVNQHPSFMFNGNNDIFIAVLNSSAAEVAAKRSKCKVSVKARDSIFQEPELSGKLICKLNEIDWKLVQCLVGELLYNVYVNNSDNQELDCDLVLTHNCITISDSGIAFDPTQIVGVYDSSSNSQIGGQLLKEVYDKIGVEYTYNQRDGKNHFSIIFDKSIFVLDRVSRISVKMERIGEEEIIIPDVVSDVYYYETDSYRMGAISRQRNTCREILKKLPDDSKLVIIDNTGFPECAIRAFGIDERLIYSRF